MYGILLSCGSIIGNSVSILLDDTINSLDNINDTSPTIQFLKEYLDKINIKMTYSYDESNYQKARLTWIRNNMFKFTNEMFLDHHNNRVIIPTMLHLPKPKITQIIRGILESSGVIKEHVILFEVKGFVPFSNFFTENIQYLLLRLGIMASFHSFKNSVYKNPHRSNIQMIHIIKIPIEGIIADIFGFSPNDKSSFFQHDNYLFSPVKIVNYIPNYSGRVIDIEVDHPDHHNFLTNCGLVHNGGGKRSGSFAIYLEPWHADVELFLQMRKNHGDEELKARDLFYAIWMPDLFMNRVKTGGTWTLMCPDECPGLSDVYGDDFVHFLFFII